MDDDQLRQNDPANDNTSEHPTPDDALEPKDDIFSPTRDEERLENDNEPPATAAPDSPVGPQLPPDHPEFDYDNDAHETYDEGKVGATDADATEEKSGDQPHPLDPQS
ncbi:MAG TPA: hypothetical protein VJR27_00465 [Candidatus Saccharimonadales bacterium]|nr:hypothetical protein [Candidatus Saccharimonadales bacterium]